MTGQIPPSRDSRLIWSVYILITIALSIACFSSLADLLLDVHDDQTFRDNVAISEDITFFFSSEKELITGRPIAALFKYLGYTLWGNDPAWCHLFVVFVHTIASILLAVSCRQMGLSLRVSMVGGTLFLLNVTHFEAVHWISALDYPLAMMWTLVALLCYIHGLNVGSHRWTWLFCVFLALGLFSHIAAIMLWPFCLYWTWIQKCSFKIAFRRLLPSGLVLLPLLPLAIAITQRVSSIWLSIGEIAATEDPWYSRFESIRLCLWYLSRLFTTAHWLPLPFFRLQTWEMYIGGVVLVGLLVLIWRRIESAAICAAWTLLFLLPFLMVPEDLVLNLVPGPSRYLYMATAGSSLLLSWTVQEIALRVRRWGHYLYSVILICLLISSYIFLQRIEAISLYSSGRFYITRGDTQLGIERLKLAISRDRGVIDLKDTYSRLLQALMTQGDPDFMSFFSQALERFPQDPTLKIGGRIINSMSMDATIQNQALQEIRQLHQDEEFANIAAKIYFSMGRGFVKRQEYERAIVAFRHSLSFHPDRVDALTSLAMAALKMGHRTEAIEALNRAVSLESDQLESYLILASLLQEDGRDAEAEKIYYEALARDFKNVDSNTYTNLGLKLFGLGKQNAAINAYRRALVRDKENLTARINLGWTLFLQSRLDEAIGEFHYILSRRSNSFAQFNLGLIYLAKGDINAAKATYAQGVKEFGAGEAERIGAVDYLRELIRLNTQAASAREILQTYWHE